MSTKVSTWLNRVLAMGLEDQDLLFSYFSATLDAVIRLAQSKGEYDQGIMSLKASSVTVEKQEAIHSDKNSGGTAPATPHPLPARCYFNLRTSTADCCPASLNIPGRCRVVEACAIAFLGLYRSKLVHLHRTFT